MNNTRYNDLMRELSKYKELEGIKEIVEIYLTLNDDDYRVCLLECARTYSKLDKEHNKKLLHFV